MVSSDAVARRRGTQVGRNRRGARQSCRDTPANRAERRGNGQGFAGLHKPCESLIQRERSRLTLCLLAALDAIDRG